MKQKRAFKVTRLKLSELAASKEDKLNINMLFTEFEAARSVAVEKHRKSVQNQAEAQQALLEAQKIHQKLLLEMGKMSNEVAGEPVWYVFRKNGDVVFESPYGERTQRNLVRAQLQQLDRQVNNDGDGSDSDLYEEEGEDEGHSGAASA